jgi:hypothetical protein
MSWSWWQWALAGAGGMFLFPLFIALCVRSARLGWLRAEYRFARDRHDSNPNRRRESNGKAG